MQREINLHAGEEGEPFYEDWNQVMSICNAGDILKSSIQKQIRQAKEEFHFEYLYFHDVYNDDMMIYDEDSDGKPMYNFRNLDDCLRYLLSLGLKPYMELSFMPLKLARQDKGEIRFLNRMNITVPKDWDKWEGLVRATLEFCVRQYGLDQVSSWRFTSAMLYNVYLHELLTLEEYFALYLRTRRAVKAVCPKAAFLGPGADVTLLADYWEDSFLPFLDFCRKNQCLPDMVSLRLYPVDMRRFSRRNVDALRQDRNPLKRSPNFFIKEDFLHESLKKVSLLLEKEGYPPRLVCIDRWNGNVSQADPSNDICYKSALIVKTVLENRNLVHNLCYWTLSDQMAHLDVSFAESELTGSVGLVTRDGLRKSAFYGMLLLSRLNGQVLAEGDGYIALKNETGFLLLFYQYCHYDKEAIARMLRRQTFRDPYEMFQIGDRQVYSITLEGVPGKSYQAEYYSVGRRSGGNLSETWRRLGFPQILNAWQHSYLEGASLPAYRMGRLYAENGTLRLNCVVEPHDVILIRLTPQG